MGGAQTVPLLDYIMPLVAINGCCGGNWQPALELVWQVSCEWDVVRECQDLLAGFMGIGLEKSVCVTVCDSDKWQNWIDIRVSMNST